MNVGWCRVDLAVTVTVVVLCRLTENRTAIFRETGTETDSVFKKTENNRKPTKNNRKTDGLDFPEQFFESLKCGMNVPIIALPCAPPKQHGSASDQLIFVLLT